MFKPRLALAESGLCLFEGEMEKVGKGQRRETEAAG